MLASRFLLAVVIGTALHGEGFVRGVVLDPDERPVEGALVRILAPSGSTLAEGLTGGEGAFEIAATARGSFSIVAESAGFTRVRQAVNLPAAGNVQLRLSLAGARSEITVTAARGLVGQSDSSEAMVESRGREWLLARPLPTIGHAIEAGPGILVQQTSAGQVSPFLRGLTGYQVLNLVDGIRYNNSTFRSGPNQYLAFIEPSQAQRIETTLGPSSAQYGSDSLGGTIQVLTREAPFGLSRRVEAHGDWNLHGATGDASAGSDAHISLGTSRWTWLGGASARRHAGLRSGGGADSRHVLRRYFGWNGALAGRLQDTGFSQRGLDTKFAARPGPNQIVSLWYQHSKLSGSRNYKDLWGGLGRLESALEPQTLHFAYARYERGNLGRLGSLSATFSANAQGDGSRRQNLRATDPITTDVSQVNAYGYSVQGTTHFGRRHAVVFGGEFYDEHIASGRTTWNPVSGLTVSARPLYPDGSRYRTAAVFAQDHFELSSRLRATVGGRATRVRYTTASDRYGTLASERSFADWSFNAALAGQITGALSMHGLVGRGFRAPNANDLGAVGLNDLGYEIPAAEALPAGALLGASSGEGAVSLGRPVADLKPERMLNYEFGLRWRQRRVQARAQVFDSELYDPIVRRTLLFPGDHAPAALAGLPVRALTATPAQQAQGVVTVATALDPRAVKAFVNDGRASYRGVESSLRVLVGSHWSVEAAYSFLAGRDLNPNRHIRRLPPQQGALALRYARTRFWWQASALAAGAQRRLSGGDLDDERIGASRSRSDIAALFQAARLAPYIRQGVFTPTGETLRQVQDRLLPGVADATRVPLYTRTAGWLACHLAGGIPLTDRMSVNAGIFNLLDRNYRIHGSGIDAPGVSAFLGLRLMW